MHQENNAPFMTKNVNFAFFPWTHLGHSEKSTGNSNMQNSIMLFTFFGQMLFLGELGAGDRNC